MYSGIKLSVLETCTMDIKFNHPKGLDYISSLSIAEMCEDSLLKSWGFKPMTATLLRRRLEEKK